MLKQVFAILQFPLMLTILMVGGLTTISVSPCFSQTSVEKKGMLFPRGGERFATGSDIPVQWDASNFSPREILRIDVWSITDGQWAIVNNNVPNTGASTIVLGPLELVRIRVVSGASNVKVETNGYIDVQEDKPANEGIFNQSIQPLLRPNVIRLNQLSDHIDSHEVTQANVEVYSYDGRLLHKGDSLDRLIKVIDGNTRVLVHVNRQDSPKRVTLIVQP